MRESTENTDHPRAADNELTTENKRNAHTLDDGAETPPPALFPDSDSDFEDFPTPPKNGSSSRPGSTSTNSHNNSGTGNEGQQMHRYSEVVARDDNDTAARRERKNFKLVRRILRDPSILTKALDGVV